MDRCRRTSVRSCRCRSSASSRWWTTISMASSRCRSPATSPTCLSLSSSRASTPTQTSSPSAWASRMPSRSSSSASRARSLALGAAAALTAAALVSAQQAPPQDAARPAPRLVAGPMAAVAGPTTAAVWVQTNVPAEVTIRCVPRGVQQASPATAAARTDAARECTAVLRVEGLQPATTYEYEVSIVTAASDAPAALTGATAKLRFDTEPLVAQARDLTIAFGSCAYLNDEGES